MPLANRSIEANNQVDFGEREASQSCFNRRLRNEIELQLAWLKREEQKDCESNEM